MSGFSSEWLALREPADTAARSTAVVDRLAALLRARPLSRFVDLGCGTGANPRYLQARTSGAQQWTLVDSDEGLLAHARTRMAHVETRQIDLASGLDSLPLEEGGVVTASALLDLVSADWLRRLLARCHASRSILLFALSYDGRIELSPREADDDWIRDLVNRHQRTDKGFGPALGPAATDFARTCLEELNYRVEVAPSDWVLGAADARIQEELLKGWAAAAAEVAAGETSAIEMAGDDRASAARVRCDRWLTTRLAHLSRGVSGVRVGHQDLIAWPG
ncbi:MAG TPA: class I SAM-dependent methyltransferase [Steroidobacteraceae bacterium]